MSTDGERLSRAGNYVLGLLEESERAAMERDMKTDPALNLAVVRFAERMHALDETTASEPVSSQIWPRIAKAIAGTPQEQPAARIIPLARKAGVGAPGAWRTAAMAAAIVVALGVGYLAGSNIATMPQPVVLVVLETPDNLPGAIFEAFADNSVRIVPLQDFIVPEGKIMQVWTLYDRSVGPVSLGTMTRARVTVLGAHALPRPAAEQLYEITLESAPGSPSGKPTGPILVKGFAKRPAGG